MQTCGGQLILSTTAAVANPTDAVQPGRLLSPESEMADGAVALATVEAESPAALVTGRRQRIRTGGEGEGTALLSG